MCVAAMSFREEFVILRHSRNLIRPEMSEFIRQNLSEERSYQSSNYSSALANEYALNTTSSIELDPHQSGSGGSSAEQIFNYTLAIVALTLIIAITIVGNAFVILAIVYDKTLRRVGNYLVMSLAVADLMVAVLVMPLGAVYEVKKNWIFGPELCEFWTASDVLCCTASILHLVAIATDRYWAVTRVDYVRFRSNRQIGSMIFLIWFSAVVVSFGPVFGWKDEDFLRRVEEEEKCLLSQDVGYQIFATMASFYVPLVVILILYYKIFREASKRIRHKPGNRLAIGLRKMSSRVRRKGGGGSNSTELTTFIENSNAPSPDRLSTCTTNNGVNYSSQGEDCSLVVTVSSPKTQTKVKKVPKTKKKESVEAKRERKAAKTLAIITGVFVICWLPFFIMALLMALCPVGCGPPPMLFSILLWSGYLNSLLNPVIYTIFSPDFRTAFRKILRVKACAPNRSV